jgi:hypothetical protein
MYDLSFSGVCLGETMFINGIQPEPPYCVCEKQTLLGYHDGYARCLPYSWSK